MLRMLCSLAFSAVILMTAQAETRKVSEPEDRFQWLEDVSGDKAMEWVQAQNAFTVAELTQSADFKRLNARLLEVLNSDQRIPAVSKMGEHYYNFWRDGTNKRGLWRRTSLAEYKKDAPKWDVILDLDELGTRENENWVWRGADCLEPSYELCLISLSRGGADATVTREYNLRERRFVEDGFFLPESKGGTSWIDPNTLYVGTDFGPGSMTKSGYPRVAKRWTRGTPLSAATVVYEGLPDDVWVYAAKDHTPGFEREFIYRGLTFWTSEVQLKRGDTWVKLDKPADANAAAHREWLLLELRSDWQVGGKTYPAGALLVTKLEAFLAGERDFELLFEPGPRKSLAGFSPTRNHILINELDNVRNRIYALTPGASGWSRQALAGAPEFGTVVASAVDDDNSDAFWMTVTDYLTPSSLFMGEIGGAAPEKLKSLPAFFDKEGLTVEQRTAKSADGTLVPYFIIAPEDVRLNGRNPTILWGYGGFEISVLPTYNAGAGLAWLEHGGVYVVANIRGGGEFGPAWHQAALKAHRHKAFEDFIAVAEDLVARKVTSPEHLGAIGGSNGGLLVGNMLTMRPDLFGAIVCQVPLLDMRRYHLLLAGASWMGEYGNPDDPNDWGFLQRYSPYHNVKPDVDYPRILFTTSTRDDRVHPGHARKMAALMESMKHDFRYYENIEGGHAGAADNTQQAFMSALAYTFFARELR